MGLAKVNAELDLEALKERHRRHRGPARALGASACSRARACASCRAPAGWSARNEVVADTADGERAVRRRRGARLHRLAAPHPRLGAGRRRARPHDPRTPTRRRRSRAPRRDRLGRHRRRVRAHVHVVRLRGHPDRQPPAGAPGQGRRGRRRAEENFLEPRRAPAQGRPGRPASTAPTDGGVRRALRRRPLRRGQPRAAGHRVDPEQRRPRASTPPGSRSTTAATCRSTSHCVTNVRHIYAAGDLSGKLPLSSVAAMQGRKIAEHVMGGHSRAAPPPRLRQGGLGHLHRARDRRRRPGRGRRLRRGPQDPGDQGAVLGIGQGADQQRPARVREDPVRPGHRRGARRLDRRPGTRPS